jgi:hypothetical protein
MMADKFADKFAASLSKEDWETIFLNDGIISGELFKRYCRLNDIQNPPYQNVEIEVSKNDLLRLLNKIKQDRRK